MAKRSPSRQTFDLTVIFAMTIAIAALYLAKDVFVPLALAGLLSFLLAPPATRLERRGFPRTLSTLTLITVAFSLIACLGWVVWDQVYGLLENVDSYKGEIAQKLQSLHGNGGVVGRAVQQISTLFDSASRGPTTLPLGSPGSTSANPLYTTLISQSSSNWQTVSTYIGLSLGPAATAGLVVVVTVFLLLKREDVRDRTISLISHGRYTVTTKALDDAATRISKYMVAQSIVNATFGIAVGTGLWLIGEIFGHGRGFPNAALWGLLAAVLRFVPYVGPIVSAIIPLVLSLAIYPGFSVFIAVGVWIILVELVSNNAMEPWLYGASTGLSPVALLVSAIFWTWLWGPVGLLLATPLTVCLVVLGKHVPQLKFLDVLLSDEPALPADVSLFQRLLAQNIHEARRLSDQLLAERGERFFDEVAIPALRLARRERNDNRLSADDETAVFYGLEEIVVRAAAELTPKSSESSEILAIGVPSHHRGEELILQMLSKLAGPGQIESVSTRLLPVEIETLIQEKQPVVVFVSILPPGGIVQARYLCRRLRKKFPDLKILVGYFGRARNFDQLLVRLRSAGATYVMTSLLQSRNQIVSLGSATPLQKSL